MSTISSIESNVVYKRPLWQNITTLTLGFWLSASLFLDWVIMPSLYISGMMSQDSFASAGYSIFWSFNRIELLCAGLVLTGVLVLSNSRFRNSPVITFLAVLLLAISFADTYFLTPQMSAIGVNLSLFNSLSPIPVTMNVLHGLYWVLDVVKLVIGGVILGWSWQQKV
ncbi:hypothetical protein [Calothrix sp. UHCC 0171]|uniref:hypothetical protein n=1 Tax=Calothrix sp. UHCC 0171 TaxID=3110245 RepID=UPI002B20ED6D|nr:hypothetical protein [Calothrix sp. UHCC 0171]MEA5572302.1 hypothetical protein [Calothrix sp. UHCC 0171]